MKKSFRIIYLVLSIMFIVYLALPNPEFPKPPSDALQSNEPADIETTLRRGYFTDFSRAEVIEHYEKVYNAKKFAGVPLISYRLNYPPEEAQTIIRDQTRSTFLEEIVHPLRDSIFINGFEPTKDKDLIRVEGKLWRQKIIVRYHPSNKYARLMLGIILCVSGMFIIENFARHLNSLIDQTKIWIKRK